MRDPQPQVVSNRPLTLRLPPRKNPISPRKRKQRRIILSCWLLCESNKITCRPPISQSRGPCASIFFYSARTGECMRIHTKRDTS
uniref:Uncharacterized protein n=1 Tax=Rhizophora mucronata TaxID=61149 RepID=A0A2P2Q779_RHIMU